jgi:Ca-activated chloride channel family protein
MPRALLVLVIAASVAQAGDLPRFAGMYQQAGQPLPMLNSSVDVIVRGPLLEVIVTQRFTNQTDRAIEATYIFPLPPDAAVSAMSITSGSKTIKAKIASRAEAQQRYEQAVRAGVVAGVLDQERPDIFTQTVAGIAPRSTVDVTIRYDALAHFYDGAWGLAIPMVVAPRYVAGTATSRPTTGTGRAPDTERAPDASRVTPAGAPGAGGATAVTITYVDKAWDITSPTHELSVAGQKATFTDARSDHDAIVRWKAANAAGWVEQTPGGAFAAVVVEAPAAQAGAGSSPARKGALRCLLVLDRSAASRGDADALAQPLVRQFLSTLDANDRVAVTGSDSLTWSPPQTVQRMLDQTWTQKSTAFDLTRVLAAARPEGAPIVLVTGGLVADDRAAVAAAKKLGVPVHVIGVGPAPARGLLVQIATATGGTARFVAPSDDLPQLARSVIADAASPLAPLTVNWGTLAASEVVPGTLPRLGAGQAVLVLARVQKAQTANARAGGELFAIEQLASPKSVDGATANVGPLGRRWARSRLEEMLSAKHDAAAVTRLALQFGLVSPYTSMVAIGDEVVVQGGTRRSVAVPVSVPAGMKWQAVKRETTVDTGSTKLEQEPQQEKKPKVGAKRTEGAGTKTGVATQKPPEPANQPVLDRRIEAEEENAEPKKKRDYRREDDESDGEDEDLAPATRDVAVAKEYGGELIETTGSIASPGLFGSRLRLTTSFSGGFARAERTNRGLAALSMRAEYGRRFLLGVDSSLLLVGGDDVQGRVYLTASMRRVGSRYLELGIGQGVHFGAGTGLAVGASLRYHLPPAPRGAVFLRYDAAFLRADDERRTQQQLTLGVEWGF